MGVHTQNGKDFHGTKISPLLPSFVTVRKKMGMFYVFQIVVDETDGQLMRCHRADHRPITVLVGLPGRTLSFNPKWLTVAHQSHTLMLHRVETLRSALCECIRVTLGGHERHLLNLIDLPNLRTPSPRPPHRNYHHHDVLSLIFDGIATTRFGRFAWSKAAQQCHLASARERRGMGPYLDTRIYYITRGRS